jgi:hypothetical protein
MREGMSSSSNASGSAHSSAGSSSSSSSPLSLSSLRQSSRSFFLGLVLALLVCLVHFAFQSTRSVDSWRARTVQLNAWTTSHAVGMREVSVLAARAGEERLDSATRVGAREVSVLAARAGEERLDSATRVGYARKQVVDRFRSDPEVERINEVKESGVARPNDDESWQARMASVRLASGSESLRGRVARSGARWTEAAALALRRAGSKRRRSVPRARVHPLVGSSGHAYYAKRTLVLYSFQPADQEALANMEFFIDTAVREHHAADYVFVLQRSELRPVNITALPKLPPNARYIHYPGSGRAAAAAASASTEECGGLGVIGWLLRLQHESESSTGARVPAVVDSASSPLFIAFGHYGHTMLLDSTMRGPWFPTWIDLDQPARVWFAAFQFHIERNQPDMHLVGATISCQYNQPHVQLGAVMIDGAGWDLVDANRTALLQCVPPTKSATLTALGLSQTMLQAGSNIGSQMLAYQELDFRVNRDCLGMAADPQYDELKGVEISDGHYMDPYEILFVKYTREFKHYKAETFSDWKRWETERLEFNTRSDRYTRRWTETDFRTEEEVKSKEEEARMTPATPT